MSVSDGRLVSEVLAHDRGRTVTVYLPPGPVDAVVYAADGGWHIERLGTALEAVGVDTTMVVGVHGLDDDEGRLAEYVPGVDGGRFAAHRRFFVDDVAGWVASRFGPAPPASRTAVWGASLGAELALALGIAHPDRYGAVLAASPGAGYRPPTPLPNDLPRCSLIAGTDEPFFLDNARRWADALGSASADVVLAERPGGHGGAFWFEEFPTMVAWAFEADPGRPATTSTP